MSEWAIDKRAGHCSACERAFEDDEAHSSLLHAADERLARADLCDACRSDERLAGALFWWRTRHRGAGGGPRLDLEAVEALFGSLAARGERNLAELRYLLALILLRKRRLKVVRVARRHEGRDGEFFIVRRPRRKDELVVEVFDLDSERIGALRADLAAIFEGGDLGDVRVGEAGPEVDVQGADDGAPEGAEPGPSEGAEGPSGEPAAGVSDEPAR